MSTTPEDRIRNQFRGMKRRLNPRSENINGIIMRLARQWKRPCAEIRKIVGWPGPNSPGYKSEK